MRIRRSKAVLGSEKRISLLGWQLYYHPNAWSKAVENPKKKIRQIRPYPPRRGAIGAGNACKASSRRQEVEREADLAHTLKRPQCC